MSAIAVRTLSPQQRRRAMAWGHAQGALWSIGNGLTTGTLIIYLALELGAGGRGLGIVLALPALAGVLRLLAPLLIGWCRGYKPAALAILSVSYLLMLLVPASASSAAPAADRLVIFLQLLIAHQLLEHIGMVAIWSWLGEIVPLRVRGRYFARRQRWQLAVLIPTLLISGWIADQLQHGRSALPGDSLIGYTLPISVGGAFLLASVAPLVFMPAVTMGARRWSGELRTIATALGDWRFQRLLMFGCWFSFFNGLTQSVQGAYPKVVLGLGVLPLVLMRTGMQIGQFSLAGWVGRFSDRYGNRPVLQVCQLLVASGLLFFLLARPDQPWWIVGAWVVWSAYVGLNICLPNLMLKLSTPEAKAAYVAIYFGITSVAYAVSTIAGGWIYDYLRYEQFYVGPFRFDAYGYLFYIGWITRTLGVAVLLAIVEPGAWTWPEILRGRRRATATAGKPQEIPAPLEA